MRQYQELIRTALRGHQKDDRTGTGTIGVFGHQMRFNLQEGFPLSTTKRLHMHSIVHELLWFIRGDTNTRYLNENGVRIWNEWADENGDLGPVYGRQWRRWEGAGTHVDQLANAIDLLRTNPDSRRIIVSAWNPIDVPHMALPPCHLLFQFYSRKHALGHRVLSCQLYQRSADIGLGVPFNIASYALLTHMVAQVTDHIAGDFVWTGGDCHVYSNHIQALTEQLGRKVKPLPELVLDPSIREIENFRAEHVVIKDYDPHPHIKMEVAV